MKQKSADTGQPPDFHSLFKAHGERVYRWALFLGVNAGGAEEIAQEVFITAMKKKQIPHDEKAQTGWLFQIVRRHVANYRRSVWIKRVFGMDDVSTLQVTGASLDDLDDNLHMRKILGQMPQKWSEVLLMHDLDGYTRDEISSILHIAEGTVASRLRSARAAFIEKWVEVTDE